MDSKQAFSFLEHLQSKGIRLGLGRMKRFLSLLGNPEGKFKAVHIAGTNGKGSTAAMLESILRQAGFKTGLYTSPHLVAFNERIKVNGKEISSKRLAALVEELKGKMSKSRIYLTYFEFVTCLAFRHFENSKVEIAVIETGLGGRLDATNVVTPLVSAITNVEREHEEHLGNGLEKIAWEKAGIVKKGVPVVTAEEKEKVLGVFRAAAKEKKSRLVLVKQGFKGKLSLLGQFQRKNAGLAAAVVKELKLQGIKIGKTAVEKGFRETEWPGRFQILKRKPAIILDCAHNPACCSALVKAFRKFFPGKKALLVIGLSNGKKPGEMAKALAPIVEKAFITGAKYRAMPLKKVKTGFDAVGIGALQVPGVKNALRKAISAARKQDIILVSGSCFVVGEALEFLGKS